MANVYYGDAYAHGTVPALDGNWNTVSNWYASLGGQGGCCCPGRGTPLGRLPQAGDTVILAGSFAGPNTITVGPVGGWAGPLILGGVQFAFAMGIASGTYSGPVTVNSPCTLSGGTFTGAVTVNNGGTISGGKFSNTVALAQTGALITGGTFTGKVTQSSTTNGISGGTYTPFGALPLGNQVYAGPNSVRDAVPYQLPASSISLLPVDPGFAVGGGTYAPVIVITGVP